VADLQRTVDRRLDTLEGRLENLPQPSDVSRLSDRLARVEEQSSKAGRDAKSASDKLNDLENRIGVVEDQSAGADDATTTPDRP
jgi:predicted  nucleic acid-binding Zn-ribbon protein